jgi:serine/threonine protein kinase
LAKAKGFTTEKEGRSSHAEPPGAQRSRPPNTIGASPLMLFDHILQEIVEGKDATKLHFVDLIRQLLMFDPTQRITVRDALRHPSFSTPIANEK